MAKTLEQITSELTTAIKSAFSTNPVDTRVGTFMNTAVITPSATQFFDLDSSIATVGSDQSIQSPENLDAATMNGLAANVGIKRFTGSPSVGIVRFGKIAAPASPITILAGSRVGNTSADTSATLIYTTLASVQITPTSPPDPITGAAASVDVAAVATFNGGVGDVDTGTINRIISSLPGVDVVTNPNAFSGGKDSQSNTELAGLITARYQGNIGTKSGYRDEVLQNFSVTDVAVIGPNDADSVRSQFGGSVDIIILNPTTVNQVQVFAYAGPSTTVLVPTILPMSSVNAITGTDSLSAPITLSGPPTGVGAGVDYDVIIDTDGLNAGSVKESSHIFLHPTANIPGNNSLLTASYQNNQLVVIIQSFFDNPDNQVIGADVEVKAAVRIGTTVTANVKLIPGFDSTTVTTNINASVASLYSGLLLGVPLEESQVITAISNVAGVSFVDVPSFVLAYTVTPSTPENQILARQQQYIALDTLTVTYI